MLWLGLNDKVRYRAVRRNDGDKMIMHWKFDMVHFLVQGHPKYLIYATRLLITQNGGVSPQLAYQLRWNRTVQCVPGVEKNIEMDLKNEFGNKDYKGKCTVTFILSTAYTYSIMTTQ